MNIDETAAILALVAKGDNRKVDRETIVFWHDLIGDLDFGEAQQAVRAFRRESTDYLMPAHVRQRVAAVRRERLSRAGHLVPGGDPDDPGWFLRLRELRRQVAGGSTRQIGR